MTQEHAESPEQRIYHAARIISHQLTHHLFVSSTLPPFNPATVQDTLTTVAGEFYQYYWNIAANYLDHRTWAYGLVLWGPNHPCIHTIDAGPRLAAIPALPNRLCSLIPEFDRTLQPDHDICDFLIASVLDDIGSATSDLRTLPIRLEKIPVERRAIQELLHNLLAGKYQLADSSWLDTLGHYIREGWDHASHQ